MLTVMNTVEYEPFSPGPSGAGVRTIEAPDPRRGRTFPCELWYPAARAASPQHAVAEERDAPPDPGQHPLIIFSHFSGGGRRTASYLAIHLASHGYVVAAMDHSEVVAPELASGGGQTAADKARRIDAIIASRVPDVRFLLAYLLGSPAAAGLAGLRLDQDRIGVVGHSFGGWTALAVPEQEPRVRAVVALAPGGSSRPLPGVLPLTLTFGWEREAALLILAGDCDVPVPLEGVQEVFDRAPEPKRMFVLHRADHQHFADDVEASHEALRAMTLPGDAAWITAAMLPASELCLAENAHLFTRGLTLAHLDATLRQDQAAEKFLAGSAACALAARGIGASEYGCE
jgi:dienelactone hydrolase